MIEIEGCYWYSKQSKRWVYHLPWSAKQSDEQAAESLRLLRVLDEAQGVDLTAPMPDRWIERHS